MSNYSIEPIPDREARTHITAVYVLENGRLALYCRKCARTLTEGLGTILDLRDFNELAKEHRTEMRTHA